MNKPTPRTVTSTRNTKRPREVALDQLTLTTGGSDTFLTPGGYKVKGSGKNWTPPSGTGS